MFTKTLFVLMAFVVSGCAASSTPSESQSTATVQIASISPSPGAAVNADTTLLAELDYTIENFDPRQQYFVMPQFDSTRGEGHTFNALAGPISGLRLDTASGRVQVAHPIRAEWSHRFLAKPVRVTFFLTVRTGRDRTTVIGRTETVQFGPAV